MKNKQINPIAAQMKQILDGGQFVVLDTETTGLGRADEILQIGILDHNAQEVMSTLVCPTVPSAIQPRAVEVHGITTEMVVGKPTIKDLENKLIAALSNKFIIAYNAEFDKRMLTQSAMAVGATGILTQTPCQWIDIMRPYQRLMGFKRWQSLTKACIQQGIAIENAHSAMGDCHLLFKLFKRIAEIM